MTVQEINCDFPACTNDESKYNFEFSPSTDLGCSLKPPNTVLASTHNQCLRIYTRKTHNVYRIRSIHRTARYRMEAHMVFGNDLGVLIGVCAVNGMNAILLLTPVLPYEPRYEKTGFLHMRKQRRRSASR